MNIRVMRLTENASIPTYATTWAAGMDLYSSNDSPIYLRPGEIRKIPTGIAVEIPTGYNGEVRGRSGWSLKGLWVALGTIDADYRGEIGVICKNVSRNLVQINEGMRIAQLVIAPVESCVVEMVESLSDTARGCGGFGSTGG